eukprot:2234471-Amphidinium_carterae.1
MVSYRHPGVADPSGGVPLCGSSNAGLGWQRSVLCVHSTPYGGQELSPVLCWGRAAALFGRLLAGLLP